MIEEPAVGRGRPLRFGIALVLAIGLHLLVGWTAGHVRCASDTPIPLLVSGKSSVRLTLAPSPDVPEPADEPRIDEDPEPVPAKPPPEPEARVVEPLPELRPRPESMAIRDVVEEPVDVPEETFLPEQPEAAPPADASLEDKGVEQEVSFNEADLRRRLRYPMGSRRRGEEGIVRLFVVVNGRGRAEDIQVIESSGFPALDRAAERAVWETPFRTRSGLTRAGTVTIPVRFRLRD